MSFYNSLRHWLLAMVVLLMFGGMTIGVAPVFALSGTATSTAVPDNAAPDVGDQIT